MMKFLPKNADESLVALKEELYDRVKEISEEFKKRTFTEEDSYGAGYEDRMAMEHNYLLRLLDVLEKS